MSSAFGGEFVRLTITSDALIWNLVDILITDNGLPITNPIYDLLYLEYVFSIFQHIFFTILHTIH